MCQEINLKNEGTFFPVKPRNELSRIRAKSFSQSGEDIISIHDEKLQCLIQSCILETFT